MAITYEAARNAYLEDFKHLLDASPEMEATALRSTGGVPEDILAERVSTLADKSQELTEATASYLHSDNDAMRQTAASSLLEQAGADLLVAQTLCEILTSGADAQDASPLRSTGSIQLRLAARDLEDMLPASIDPETQAMRSGPTMRPQNIEDAIPDMKQEIEKTLELIKSRANQVSAIFARDLLKIASRQWNLIVTGAQLVGQVAGGENIVKTVAQGMDSAFGNIANALGKIISTIIGKITAFLQGNDEAREKVLDLLNQAKDATENEREDLFEKLTDRVLGIRSFLGIELPIWLEDASSKEIKRIHDVANMAAQLRENYGILADQAQKLSKYISLGSIIAGTPPLTAIAFGLQVGLLTTVIFAAYDYVDAGGKGLNITKGLKEILTVQLDIPEATRQRAALAVQNAAKQNENS